MVLENEYTKQQQQTATDSKQEQQQNSIAPVTQTVNIEPSINNIA